MDKLTQYDELAAKLRAGDDVALELMFQQFSERLINVARSRIAIYYRNKTDAEDIVQSVFKSFLRRFRDDKLDFQSGNGLWGLLTIITLRKCADRIEHHRAACRDVRREVSLFANGAYDGSSFRSIIDREPIPEEACALAEMVEQLFSGFDAEDRAIVELQLQGATTTETAAQLNRAERSVRRIRERVRNRLLRELAGEQVLIDSEVRSALVE